MYAWADGRELHNRVQRLQHGGGDVQGHPDDDGPRDQECEWCEHGEQSPDCAGSHGSSVAGETQDQSRFSAVSVKLFPEGKELLSHPVGNQEYGLGAPPHTPQFENSELWAEKDHLSPCFCTRFLDGQLPLAIAYSRVIPAGATATTTALHTISLNLGYLVISVSACLLTLCQ